MEKKVELKDVAKHYLHQRCEVDFSKYIDSTGKSLSHNDKTKVICVFDSINRNAAIDQCWGVTVEAEGGFVWEDFFNQPAKLYTCFVKSGDIKLILRPLTSLTDDEKVAYEGFKRLVTDGVHVVGILIDTPASFHYLLSIGIDLFNLIETNQAITV